MKNRSIIATAVLLTGSIAPAANATLTGDTISGSTQGVAYAWSSGLAIVGGGIEFIAVLANVTVTADFTADTVTLTYENTSAFPNITIPGGIVRFSDLDCTDTPGAIVGVSEISNTFPGAASFSTVFGADFIEIQVR